MPSTRGACVPMPHNSTILRSMETAVRRARGRSNMSAAVLACAVMAMAAVRPHAAQMPASREGAESPQAAVAAMRQAADTNDWRAAFALMLPSARHEMARPIVESVVMMVALADPASPFAERWSPAERAERTHAARQAVAALTRAWTPYGLETIVGAPPMAESTAAAIDTALRTADVPALMHDTMLVFDAMAPALGVPAADRPRVPPIGAVTGYVVRGDRATAREGATPVDFARVAGRWYLAPPPAK